MKLSNEDVRRYQAVIFASRAEPMWDALNKLAAHHREVARDHMEDAVEDAHMLDAQSDARAWRKVLKYLTDKPLTSFDK